MVSYPWLTQQHPDPTGFHFQTIRQYLTKHVAALSTDAEEFGVFWDFASLPQRSSDGSKTEEERRAFSRGLEVMHMLYSSAETMVIQLTAMPEATSYLGSQAFNFNPYSEHG